MAVPGDTGPPSGPGPATLPEDEAFFGRMNDPTGAGVLRGPCGDEMEFYLYIRDGVIEDAKYYTEKGCGDTRTCGLAAAKRAKGRTVMDALAINPKEILEAHRYLSMEGRHCAILAVSALYRAVADYLLQP
jgi:nitrogen fixation protein NifU and related proteins